MEDAFENDDLDTVALRLAGMAGSLRLLQHTQDYRERVAHLEHQRNRLEATLSPQVLPSSSSSHHLPQLVTAFTSLDTEAACRLVAMFRGMERGEQLAKYYSKCVRAGLVQVVPSPRTPSGGQSWWRRGMGRAAGQWQPSTQN